MLSLLAAVALQVASTGSTPPLLTAEGTSVGEVKSDMPFIAVTIDAGLPDGLGASLSVMPLSFLRVSLGGLTNGVGAGVRLGVTLLAFPRWPVRPLVSVDGGYVFGGHAPWALDFITDTSLRTALSQVNVGFVNAHAGLEMGSRNIAVVLRGGVSWIDVDLGGQSLTLGGGVSVTAAATSLRGFIPSARLGLMISFG